MSGESKGGNDILIAGTAAPGCTVINDMWGDGLKGGQDQFVLKDAASMTVGSHNTIEDFSQSQHEVKFVDVANQYAIRGVRVSRTSVLDTVEQTRDYRSRNLPATASALPLSEYNTSTIRRRRHVQMAAHERNYTSFRTLQSSVVARWPCILL
jgi:hypothetical protein